MEWLKCDFAGCKRDKDGECTHCGFHPGELIFASEERKREIIERYTAPVSNGNQMAESLIDFLNWRRKMADRQMRQLVAEFKREARALKPELTERELNEIVCRMETEHDAALHLSLGSAGP